MAASCADAHGCRDRATGDLFTGELKGTAHALGDGERLPQRCRNDRRKLFAAEPTEEIARAHVRGHGGCERAQRFVAERMTETIVDRLEVVEVEDENADRLALACLLREQLLRAVTQRTAIQKPGQRVGRGGG